MADTIETTTVTEKPTVTVTQSESISNSFIKFRKIESVNDEYNDKTNTCYFVNDTHKILFNGTYYDGGNDNPQQTISIDLNNNKIKSGTTTYTLSLNNGILSLSSFTPLTLSVKCLPSLAEYNTEISYLTISYNATAGDNKSNLKCLSMSYSGAYNGIITFNNTNSATISLNNADTTHNLTVTYTFDDSPGANITNSNYTVFARLKYNNFVVHANSLPATNNQASTINGIVKDNNIVKEYSAGAAFNTSTETLTYFVSKDTKTFTFLGQSVECDNGTGKINIYDDEYTYYCFKKGSQIAQYNVAN